MAEFGQQHQDWFERLAPLPSGIASHDTFARVFRLLDAKELSGPANNGSPRWQAGYTARWPLTVRARQQQSRCLAGHRTWSAPGRQTWDCCWASARSMARATRSRPFPSCCACCTSKAASSPSMPSAAKSIAGQLHEHGADYVLSQGATKTHAPVVQNTLKRRDSQERFEENTYTESCSGHGRQELRSYRLSPVPEEALQRAAAHWPGLASVVQVVRQAPASGKRGQRRSQLLPGAACQRTRPRRCWRTASGAHWSVENQLHWSLDVAMREDAAQSYKDQSPHNQTVLRRMALQVLKNDTSVKIGLQAKRKRRGGVWAIWNALWHLRLDAIACLFLLCDGKMPDYRSVCPAWMFRGRMHS